MSDYKLRPSGSARWLACPASLLLEAQAPVVKSMNNIAAYLGSATHELLEKCVKDQKKPVEYRGDFITVFDEESMEFPYTVQVDQRMIESVQFFLDEVGEPPVEAEVYSELEMEHSELPELRGTADYICICDDHALLADLKNGTSIVQVKKRDGTLNTQLLSYASMVFDKFPKVQTMTIAIIQPNGKTKKKVRSTGINRKTADEFMERVRKTSETVNEITPSNITEHSEIGSHCYWCAAKGICPLQAKAEINRDFDKI